MVNRNSDNPIARLSPGLLLLIGLVLTASIMLAIKFMVRDEEPPAPAPAAGADKLFNQGGEQLTPPGYNPAARSETTSGDSLDIFSKTNKGYDEEDSSAAVSAAAPDKAAAAAPAKAAAAQKPRAAGTVIPKLAPKEFGTASQPKSVRQGAGMPDIQSLLKDAQKKTGGR